MPYIQPAMRPLALALILIGDTVVARDTDTSPVPPLPKYNQFALSGGQPPVFGANGEVEWIAVDYKRSVARPGMRCGFYPVVKRTWLPATGAVSEVALGVEAEGAAYQLATPSGIVFVSSAECGAANNQIFLLPPNGKAIKASLQQRFAQPRLALLSTGAVAVLERDEATRHIRTDIVQLRGGGIAGVERMPELPVPTRNDFSEAPLPDGGLMVLGGSDAQYRGCSPCRAETHVLDPKTKSWKPGPTMLEPRSEHLATSLPDGSILVTGGWTPTHGWGHGPSRSAERWNPTSNKFEAAVPMPSGTARHRAVWMPGQKGATLLIAGGNNSSIHAYDIRSGEWRTAGATWQGNEGGGDVFIPFVLAGNTYAWSGESVRWQEQWQLTALRARKSVAAPAPAPEKFLVTYRGPAALVPASGDKPALLIGGTIHAGSNSYLATSAVEAVTSNGDVYSMPSLLDARRGAAAYRFGDGVLVIGGTGEDSNTSEQSGTKLYSIEWLASDTPQSRSRWVKLADAAALAHAAALHQAPDGSLIAFDGNSGVSRITLKPGRDGLPAIQTDHDAYPPLARARNSFGELSTANSSVIQIRHLADGRVVVAGGQVQSDKIALLGEDSDKPNAADEYIGIGEYLPSRRHEIYEPATKRWRSSAPSRGVGGKVAILSDGRVLKIGQLPGKNEGEQTYVLEIANAEGAAWSTLPAEARPKTRLDDSTIPFVVNDELFLAGRLEDNANGGSSKSVEWFNSAAGKWEVLWQASPKDNWRDHQGRMIVRQLANGKKVVLPVNGY